MSAQFAGTATSEAIKVLFVGKDQGDAARVRGLLEMASSENYEVQQSMCIADALHCLDIDGFKAILLALTAGSDEGPDSVAKLSQHAPTVPVVVIAEANGEGLWEKMPKEAVHGFLIGEHLTAAMLESAVRTALQINSLQQELRETRLREQHERRMRLLERLSGSPQTVVTTHNRGGETLKESSLEKFMSLSHQYGEVLDMVLSRNASSRVISDALRAISEELGIMKAGPNDLLDIHGHALRMKSCGASEKQAETCAEESRLMLIEAMGYLTSYYRNYSNYTLSIINTISPEARRIPKPQAASLHSAIR